MLDTMVISMRIGIIPVFSRTCYLWPKRFLKRETLRQSSRKYFHKQNVCKDPEKPKQIIRLPDTAKNLQPESQNVSTLRHISAHRAQNELSRVSHTEESKRKTVIRFAYGITTQEKSLKFIRPSYGFRQMLFP